MASKPEKTELSKIVLQMKFMKRTAKRVIEEDTTTQTHIDDDHWQLALPAHFTQQPQKYLTEESLQKLEDLMPGRQSFKGFNPEIERLAASVEEDQKLDEAARREAESSVSEQQMTDRYSSLVGTISKKFKGKRKQESTNCDDAEQPLKAKQKRKFLKPKD